MEGSALIQHSMYQAGRESRVNGDLVKVIFATKIISATLFENENLWARVTYGTALEDIQSCISSRCAHVSRLYYFSEDEDDHTLAITGWTWGRVQVLSPSDTV